MHYYPDKKNNLSLGSLIKTIQSNTNKNIYSTRSMTQVASRKSKNNKEKFLGKIASFNASKNISKSKNPDSKAIILEKDKEINELMLKLKMCKDKLNYIRNQNNFNTTTNNSTLNSCNLSKTRNSTTLTDRNINSINSLNILNRHYKNKPTYNLSKSKNSYFICSNNIKNQLIENLNKNILSKTRPKSSNYNKNHNCILKTTNKKAKISYSCNNKIATTNNNNNKNTKMNNIQTINKNNLNNTYKILSIETTKKIYDDIFEKTKNIFELIKNVTTK